MKYALILGDGMGDYPIPSLGGRTPLEVADKPCMNALAKTGKVGLVKTVPDGYKPGSDVANLGALGYDATKCYTGRSPLEALSIGIDMKEDDVALRMNLVTLGDEENFEDKTMRDYSAGEITTAESRELVLFLQKELGGGSFTFYPGVSYRHCLIIAHGSTDMQLTPPHDISDRCVAEYLPKGEGSEAFLDMMKRSYEILRDHPVNRARKAAGKNPANSVWFWGEGTKPRLTPFKELYGKEGAVLSAVDLVKGLGVLAGLEVIEVAGATGNWDTNFAGKAEAAAKALLQGKDFVYVHMEAPDECGHHGDVGKKIYSIEQVDGVARTVAERLRAAGEDFCLLVCPDHPTPIALKTHTSDPVPFLLYRSNAEKGNGAARYDEAAAAGTGLFLPRACEMMRALFA